MNAPDLPTQAIASAQRTLPGVIEGRLREWIIEGVLAPGERLNERVLCDKLEVSRTPLREALRRLAHDGLATMIPNRGAFVTRMSRDAVRESFEVMGALEALAAELACARISDREVDEIAALTFEMRACHARRDLSEYYRYNRAIHERISRVAHNEVLADLAQRLNLRIQNLRFRSNQSPRKWDAAVREHVRMVELLRARDGAALAQLMREHLARKAESVLATLD
jgi:DNA-binding GntR family transcriptional regulator